MLELTNIHAFYDKKEILHGTSLAVNEGEILAIIGPNGAGKSTLLKVAAGILTPTQGKISYFGEDFAPLDCAARVHHGIVYFMQGGIVFPSLTVQENLELGLYRSYDHANGIYDDILQLFPEIKNWRDRRAGLLSGGQRQQVALAMVLLKKPKVLLLDEPSAGLAPNLVKDIIQKIKETNRRFGISIILVEQNISEALRIAQRVVVLANGQIISQTDRPNDLLKREVLGQMFLGDLSTNSSS